MPTKTFPNPSSMHYVYVLQSVTDGKLYVGCTNNLRRRLHEHAAGQSFATASRRPFELIHYAAFWSQHDAEAYEKYLKTGWGRNFLKRTLKDALRAKV